MTVKEYREQIYSDRFLSTDKRHILLFKKTGMHICERLASSFNDLLGNYTMPNTSTDELAISVIEIDEEEVLKLSWWVSLVPQIMIIDNTTESAYLFDTRRYINETSTYDNKIDGFQDSFNNGSYLYDTKYSFKVGPIIEEGYETILAYIIKDTR
jgi:hypothetical protein